MRVGIDVHMLGDRSGGNESFYRGILSGLTPDAGDEYYLFVNSGVDVTEYEDRFNIVYYKKNSSIYRNCVELRKLCKKYNIDVLHTQYYLPFFAPCKTVVTIHDLSFEHIKDIFTKSEYIKDKILVSHAARKADMVVTVSEFSKQDICTTYGTDPSKIEVVYNAVDSDFTVLPKDAKIRSEVRNKFGIADDKYIVCVSNLQPRKNIPRLIRAFNKYSDNTGLDYKLVIVGKKAWMYDEIEKCVSDSNGKVILTDYVTKDELIALLNEATGCVYPSIFEGFGIPPLEAMACGTPVAASDIPVMREVLGDNELFFDPMDENAIAEAIKTLFETTPKVNAEIVRRYSWKKSADILKQVYKKAQLG